MSAELEAARAELRRIEGSLGDGDGPLPATVATLATAHAAVAQAAALERIAAWLENVQLADLTDAEEDDDRDDEIRGGWDEAFSDTDPVPTREERERAEAESRWRRVAVGDELLVDWNDGYVGSIAKTAPDQPLHPLVVRARRS